MSTSTSEPAKTPLWKSPFLWAFLVGAVFLTLLRPLQESLLLDAPPPLVEVAPWQLIDHEERVIGTESLRGKVVVGASFFTRCPSVCPKITAAMKDVVARLDEVGDDVRFVSFTVDPEFDTPAVLAAHRAATGITDPRWRFATGTPAEVRGVLVDRMKLVVGDKAPVEGDAALFDIAHQTRLALYDQNGDLRALFGIDDDGRRALVAAAKLLAQRGPNP